MSKNKKQKGFMIFYDNEVIVYRLADDEAGKLFKSLFPFAKERIKPDFIENNSALAMAFDIISLAIERNDEKYIEKCEKNRKNIEKRWNKENTTVYDRNSSNTNDTNININKNINKNINQIETKKEIETKNIKYQLIADMYNNTCVSFPRLTKLSDTRKKAIKARLKVYTVDDFQKLFEMAESSSFLKGQNPKNWSATFDWLIKDANMAKVLEGNYTDNDSSYRSAGQQSQESHDNYEIYREMYRDLPVSPDDPFQ